MIFILLSILVPGVIWITLPPIVHILSGKQVKRTGLLLFACVAYAVSWHLPSPLIDGMNTQFMTHLIGGGIFSGSLWLFLKQGLDWKSSRFIELLSLYAFVCALGVTNELLELALVELQLVRLSPLDTWWDLSANTLGALLFWLAQYISSKRRNKPSVTQSS